MILTDDHFMREALKEAQQAFDADEVPVGAVVVCDGMIIARAHNLTERLNDVTAHAEMQAITAAASYLGGKYLDQCVMFVTLEPCLMCAGALAWAQLGRLVYGADDPKRGFSMCADNILHPKTKVTKGLHADAAETMLKSFFRVRRL